MQAAVAVAEPALSLQSHSAHSEDVKVAGNSLSHCSTTLSTLCHMTCYAQFKAAQSSLFLNIHVKYCMHHVPSARTVSQ